MPLVWDLIEANIPSQRQSFWPGETLFFLLLVLALLTSRLSMRLPQWHLEPLYSYGRSAYKNAHRIWHIHQSLPRALKRQAAIG